MQAADILVELVNRDGHVVTMPTFVRPTEQEWVSDMDAAIAKNERADNAEIDWMEENEIYVHRFCSVDRTRVTIHVAGTSETATCPNGHRWLRTFGENDGYRQVN
jgi:hypothetical protein